MINFPLVLVSEIQRSGGSMMVQLFDGHPELYTHPGEIQIGGRENKLAWPALDLRRKPDAWLKRLEEPHTDVYIKHGFSKPGRNRFAQDENLPFLFDKKLQKKIFLDAAGSREISTQRDVLDCYFTSYFGALRNYPSSGRERLVAGFTPRVNMIPEYRDAFFRDYPDGRMISLVREPRSWWASLKNHNPERKTPELVPSLELWKQSARAVRELMRARESSFLPVIFEQLVREPEQQMRRVARFLGIAYQPSLVEPTYLGAPILPNSTFDVKERGIHKGVTDRAATLDATERTEVELEAVPLYEALCSEAEQFGRRYA